MHETYSKDFCLQADHTRDMLVYIKGKLQWVEIVICEGYPVLVMDLVLPH